MFTRKSLEEFQAVDKLSQKSEDVALHPPVRQLLPRSSFLIQEPNGMRQPFVELIDLHF